MSLLVVVEDDPDVQLLVEVIFSLDPRFDVVGVPDAAEAALEVARMTRPSVIVLDHGLSGPMTGLDAAAQFKKVAPQAKIILFTAHAELRGPAEAEPAIDAFLLKTDPLQLLPVAQRLTGMELRCA